MIATARTEPHTGRMPTDDALTIRWSRAGDATEIKRLAQLDSRPAPSGELLLAEVGGDLVAAAAVAGDEAIADPFRRTDHLVALLRLSLGQRHGSRRPRRSWWRIPRVRPLASPVRS